jgi:fibro-slime domain-containing protein
VIGKLVVDLGGLHTTMSASLSLDNLSTLVVGTVYPFDFFYCERHSVNSGMSRSLCIDFS